MPTQLTYHVNFKIVLLISLFLSSVTQLKAAENTESQTQALELELASAVDKDKAPILAELVWLYRNNRTEQSLIYGEQALVLLHEFPQPKVEAKVLYSIAWAHMRNGDYERAILRAKLANDIAVRFEDKQSQAYAVNVLGSVEWFKGNFLNALEHFLKTLEIRLTLGNKIDIGRSYNNIGSVYQEIGDFEKAKLYHEKSLNIMQEAKHSYGVATSFFNLGIIYQRLNNQQNEEIYLQRALTEFKTLNDNAATSEVQINLGQLKASQSKLAEALELFESSIQLSTQLNNQSLLSRALLGKASILFRQSEYDRSLELAEQSLAIANSLGEKTQLRDIYELKTKLYRHHQDFKNALESYEKHHEVKDAILENVYEGNLSLLQQKFDSEQSKARIEFLEKEKSLNELKAKQAQREYNYLLYGLLSVTFLIAIIVIQYLKLLKKNRQTFINSITDSLCDCYNRHYLFSVLIPKLVALDRPVFSMLIDLDRFKSVNDQFGHDVGDRLLSAFSQRIKQSMVDDSYFIRLGGEEFVILGSGLSEKEVMSLADKIRNNISNMPFTLTEKITLNITCSIGVSIDNVDTANDVIDLIKKGDLAMYQAKREGRNRVIGSSLRN